MSSADVSFLFVVDGLNLANQSLLLVASLRLFNPDAKLFAYVTRDTDLTRNTALASLYESCDVKIARLPEPGTLWQRSYPHGNKIIALSQNRDTEFSVFLDTDMVCLRSLPCSALPNAGEVVVVPEGKPTWGHKNDRWQRAYAHFGLELPEDRVHLVRGRRREFFPYFNAGFVAVRETDNRAGKRFASAWLETASEFDWNAPIAAKRPWLDQVTLPLTMYRFGWRYREAEEDLNYSVSNRIPETGSNPVFLHYHRYRFLAACPQLSELRTAVLEGPNKRIFAAMTEFFDELALLEES